MNTRIDSVALNDDALETVCGGGLKHAIAFGTVGAAIGGAVGAICGAVTGALVKDEPKGSPQASR